MSNTISQYLQKLGYQVTRLYEKKKIIKGKSDIEKYSFHPTSIGNYYVPTFLEGDTIAEHMKRGIFYDKEVVEMAKLLIKPNTDVIDLGSNFGQMAIEFSRHCKGGKVYSFEAQKQVFEVLSNNIKANNITNIVTHYNAVTDKSNEEVYFPEVNFDKFKTLGSFGIEFNNSQNANPVKTIKIDDIEFEKPISFMKVDIQGADLMALKGSINTIRKHKMPIIFEYEEDLSGQFNTTFQDYVEFVASIDYKFDKIIYNKNYLIIPK